MEKKKSTRDLNLEPLEFQVRSISLHHNIDKCMWQVEITATRFHRYLLKYKVINFSHSTCSHKCFPLKWSVFLGAFYFFKKTNRILSRKH